MQYCELIKLRSIEKLSKLDLNKKLLSFKKSKDLHGREAVFENDNYYDENNIDVNYLHYNTNYSNNSSNLNLNKINNQQPNFNTTNANQTRTIQNTDITYQIVLTTFPGFATYELSFKYNKLKNKFKFNKNEISRINSYNNNSNCILDKRPDLRQFCYCKIN